MPSTVTAAASIVYWTYRLPFLQKSRPSGLNREGLNVSGSLGRIVQIAPLSPGDLRKSGLWCLLWKQHPTLSTFSWRMAAAIFTLIKSVVIQWDHSPFPCHTFHSTLVIKQNRRIPSLRMHVCLFSLSSEVIGDASGAFHMPWYMSKMRQV